jgi:hypothetical protein
MWNFPAVYSLIPCRDGSDRPGGRKSHYIALTLWAVTWQPVGRFMCSWMRWKALSELNAAMVVCQWCHVTLPPSSKAQSSRCGFELKAHTMHIDWCCTFVPMQTTASQYSSIGIGISSPPMQRRWSPPQVAFHTTNGLQSNDSRSHGMTGALRHASQAEQLSGGGGDHKHAPTAVHC